MSSKVREKNHLETVLAQNVKEESRAIQFHANKGKDIQAVGGLVSSVGGMIPGQGGAIAQGVGTGISLVGGIINMKAQKEAQVMSEDLSDKTQTLKKIIDHERPDATIDPFISKQAKTTLETGTEAAPSAAQETNQTNLKVPEHSLPNQEKTNHAAETQNQQ